MAKCTSCGASFNESTLHCPYCGSSGIRSGKAGAREKTNLSAGSYFKTATKQKASGAAIEATLTENITRAEVEKHVLDSMTMGALEVAPKETAGVLFGRESEGIASIRHAQVIQEALVRTAYSTAPNPISEERIAEAEQSVIDMEFVGSYHSHPYFLKAFERPEDGLSLSQGDIAFLGQQPRTKMEMIVGYFPWQIWGVEPGPAEWQEVSTELKCSDDTKKQSKILARSIDFGIPSEQIIQVLREGLVWAQKQGDQSYAQMLSKELEQVSGYTEIKGFDIRVACHAKTGEGFEPVPANIGFSPSSVTCPKCGASVSTGETSCSFCGARF